MENRRSEFQKEVGDGEPEGSATTQTPLCPYHGSSFHRSQHEITTGGLAADCPREPHRAVVPLRGFPCNLHAYSWFSSPTFCQKNPTHFCERSFIHRLQLPRHPPPSRVSQTTFLQCPTQSCRTKPRQHQEYVYDGSRTVAHGGTTVETPS